MDIKTKTVAIIVAHPDDETLWAGGTMLSNPEWQYFVACLCRKTDPNRAPKFEKALDVLGVAGVMATLMTGLNKNHYLNTWCRKLYFNYCPHGNSI